MQQKQRRPALVVSVAAPQDVSWLIRWETSLLPLQLAGHLTIWSEQHLAAGDSRRQQINEYLTQADCIILLLSPDFFASGECITFMELALKRGQNSQVCIAPLLLRPVAWQDTPLASLSCLPSDGRPVISWCNTDEAIHACMNGICAFLGLPQAAVPIRKQIRASTLQQQNRVLLLRRLQHNYEMLLKNSLQGATRIELGLAGKGCCRF